MNAFFALVRKDLKLFLSDRRAVLMSLVAPIIIAAFFGSLFQTQGRDGPSVHATLAVTDSDNTPVSQALLATLNAQTAITVKPMSAEQARTALDAGKVHARLQVPPGFGGQATSAMMGLSSGTAMGDKPVLALEIDPSQQNLKPMLEGLLTQAAMQALTQQVQGIGQAGGGKTAASGAASNAASSAASNALSGPRFELPFTVQASQGSASTHPGAGYDSYAHSFAGMGAQFILLFGVDVGITLLALRGQGLWQRLRAAPVGRMTLLGSRMASCALIAWAIFAIVMLVGMLGFGVRVNGSLAGLVLILAAYALFTAAFGLLVAAFGRTPEAARGLAILVTLALVMLGGAWVPSFIFPPWLQTVSAWTPTHWVVSGLDAMTWRGQGLASALAPVGVLLGFAAACAALAIKRFDWGG